MFAPTMLATALAISAAAAPLQPTLREPQTSQTIEVQRGARLVHVRELDGGPEAQRAGDLTTLVAKVEAVGPAGFVTDLSLLENRYQFARYLKDAVRPA